MDFAKIKELVRKNGDKFIVIEGNEPEVVLLSFTEYMRLLGGEPGTLGVKAHARAGGGEKPAARGELAADAAGVSVAATRFAAVLAGGALSGLAGGYLALAGSRMWRRRSSIC